MELLRNRRIMGLLVLLLVLIFGLFGISAIRKPSATKTANTFIGYISKSDSSSSYKLFTSDQQATLTAEKWNSTLKSINAVIGKNVIKKESSQLQSDGVSEYLFYKVAVSGKDYRVYFVSKKVNGKWLIDSISLSPLNKST